MFTGIITATGKVLGAARVRGNVRVTIARPRGWRLAPGESVNVNGVCSTVITRAGNAAAFSVEYMPETLHITTAGRLVKGDLVNLERSLRLGDRLDGHLVQGHVDTTGTVIGVARAKGSAVITIGFPAVYRKFIAAKGSITVDGVSLTVTATAGNRFAVSLVDHTLRHTNLQNLHKGDKVNLEMDVLARYLDALRRGKK